MAPPGACLPRPVHVRRMWGAAAPLLLVLLWSGAAAAPNGPHVGWDCLRQTTPAVALRYPADALEHFEAIHRRLARFAGPLHMGGPGVKNVWVYDALRRLRYGRWRGTGHFRNDWIATVETRGPRRELRDVFGPFIPLLVTWTDVWLSGGRWRYPAGFAAEVRGVLRPDVPYVTVNQNDEVALPRPRTRPTRGRGSIQPPELGGGGGGCLGKGLS